MYGDYHSAAELDEHYDGGRIGVSYVMSHELPFWLRIGPTPWSASYMIEVYGKPATLLTHPNDDAIIRIR